MPSNVKAIEAGLLFSGGLLAFGAVYGPSGWGKSHLLEATFHQLAREAGNRGAEMASALEWLHTNRNRVGPSPLLLDNVQDALAKARPRQLLRLALERRVKAGWPTFLAFTESRLTRPIRLALPMFREWNIVGIRTPDTMERELVIGQISESEGVLLAPALRRILAHRLEGNGRTLVGALKRLRLNGSKWLTSRDVLWACGILNPFFSASSAWDLRDHVLELAGEFSGGGSDPSRQELAAYAMLRVAQLSEADVARYLELDPGRAYGVAQRVEQSLQSSSAAQETADRFVERIVTTLQPA